MAYIEGTSGKDILSGTSLWGDTIDGLEGDDVLTGNVGSDELYGGEGNDTLKGSFGSDTLSGYYGNDTLSGGSGNDELSAGAGKDKVYGNSGRDDIELGSLAMATGDIVDGGAGADSLTVDYYSSTTKLNIVIKDWITSQTLAGGITITNVENFTISGSEFGDTIVGGNYDDELNGGDGADTLTGGRGDDRLDGDLGNDTLSGGYGDDQLEGGSGSDYLSGGGGNDSLVGDDGNDKLNGSSGNDTLDGEDGDDTVEGGSDRLILQNFSGNFTAKAATEINTLTGGTTFVGMDHYSIYASGGAANKITTSIGNDEVQAGGGNDWINGAAGDDMLDGGLGKDTIYGGVGNDTVTFGEGGADIGDGGAGTDSVSVDRRSLTTSQTFSVSGTTATLTDGTRLKNFEHYSIAFGKGNDVIESVGSALSVSFYGYDGNDTLIGTDGADVLDGGNGNDTLTSGAGDDKISDRGGTNVIRAGDGADEVRAGGLTEDAVENYTVDLGAGDDYFYRSGSLGKLNLQAGSGIDSAFINLSVYASGITFELSAFVTVANASMVVKNVEQIGLIGGNGDDVFTGGSLADSLYGGYGKDSLNGGGGGDSLYGERGNDTIKGGAGNDVIYADDYYENDYYPDSAQGGADRISGDGGDDTVYMGIGDRATGGSGTDKLVLYLSEQTKDISFTFSTGTVTVDSATSFGTFESIRYTGSQGKDTITGGALDDELNGGAGNDILKGGGGNDRLHDGAGIDRLYGEGGNDTLLRVSPSDYDFYDGGSGIDTLYFYGSHSAILDLMAQEKNNGAAFGLVVANIENIQGGYYDDDIRGDANANTINGGESDDVLQGRDGNDTLNGQKGDDVLTGGKGNDKFVFDLDGRDGEGDVITDFTRGQDKLVIDRSDYGIAAGDTTVTLVVGANPVATSTKGTFLFESDNGRLWFDFDGKGTEADLELVAILQNVKTLTTGDFSLI